MRMLIKEIRECDKEGHSIGKKKSLYFMDVNCLRRICT